MAIVSARHAAYVGWVLGIARKHGVPAQPVVDDAGNYTDHLLLDFEVDTPGDGPVITIVVPHPPSDWKISDA